MYLLMANILLFFFGIGALVTGYLNKNSQVAQARERWLKLGVYFLILILVFFSIYTDHVRLLAVCIGIVGLYEIVKAHLFSERPLLFFCPIVVLYIALIVAFINFGHRTSTEKVCSIYFTIVIFDGFSQLCGQLFGKRKLIPRISPNKTFEGLIGALVIVTSTSLFLFPSIDLSFTQTLKTTLFICVSALMGDLLASWYKRSCQIKDYGTLIPGHGGVLDRFDSFIFSGAMYGLIYL
ncbi:MAG: phosphatidate cytidylyltransferase [Sphingobacterium sp.]|jgi:phosphatidate cytidylyltransferase|uniref:phosphatidate cytidylyltransferase n=1 Tax=Sphingobacterium sp. TaxID=341027 RepID=UPI00282C810A|nr:phosphatidate cytidylyltransferase [Sphingobacterium sp.]MDR0264244.1 phosphatidate cytidylyltransferase [Sphingobacterium sp.]